MAPLRHLGWLRAGCELRTLDRPLSVRPRRSDWLVNSTEPRSGVHSRSKSGHPRSHDRVKAEQIERGI